jgi:hypothetical protein
MTADGPAETFLVETAEQLRALSEPLRQRLLEQFAQGATIKQAAARLGQPPTRLYHHVDQLHAAGLIRVTKEEKRRSVIERTFQAVARRFAVSPTAFAPGENRASERERVARSTLEEMLSGAQEGEGAFRMLRTRARLNQAGRERLESELGRLLHELNDPAAEPVDLMMLSVRQG